MWKFLKEEEKFKYIFTSRLNQDCAENLFSVIRGKGGFRDNPDVGQFKDAFKYVVADKLFVQSSRSNCKVDNDQILLDITNVAMAKYIKPLPSDIEKPAGTDISMVIHPSLSLPTKNVATYIAGYLLRKIPVKDCEECSSELMLPELPSDFDELSAFEFVRNKTYQEKGSLVYPTTAMAKFVQSLETLFCAIFEGIIHMPFVLTRLCKSAEEYCNFLTCNKLQCMMRIKGMVCLYMKIRVIHALKRSNAQNAEDKSVKRNRKMLKLSNL